MTDQIPQAAIDAGARRLHGVDTGARVCAGCTADATAVLTAALESGEIVTRAQAFEIFAAPLTEQLQAAQQEIERLKEQLDALEEVGPPPAAVQFKVLLQENAALQDKLNQAIGVLREVADRGSNLVVGKRARAFLDSLDKED